MIIAMVITARLLQISIRSGMQRRPCGNKVSKTLTFVNFLTAAVSEVPRSPNRCGLVSVRLGHELTTYVLSDEALS